MLETREIREVVLGRPPKFLVWWSAACVHYSMHSLFAILQFLTNAVPLTLIYVYYASLSNNRALRRKVRFVFCFCSTLSTPITGEVEYLCALIVLA